ncbi:MAG: GHKL domain-containing protein [Leptospirales bacterium]|nr:GHKL domain-containing protein [Leptospirales bacterium]
MVFVTFYVMILCLPPKKSLRFIILIFIPLATVHTIADLIVVHYGIININVFRIIFELLVYVPVFTLLLKGYFFQKLFAFFFSQVFVTTILSFAKSLARFFMPYGEFWFWLAMLVITLLILTVYIVAVIKFGRRLFDELFIYGSSKEWGLYALNAGICFAAVEAVYVFLNESPATGILVIFFVLWNIIILCYAIINTHQKTKQKYEADFALGIISAGHGHYQKMNEMYDTLRILRHDHKYHLNAIIELASAGNIAEIKRYLLDLQTNLPDDGLRYYCKNSVINALLESYAERCADKNIAYDVRLAMPETLSVPNYDMCIILGNLLENAMKACRKLEPPASSNAKIELQVKTQGTHLAVMVKNTFNGIVNEENGQPVSKKKDGGLGLRSVRTVAARYDGHTLFEWDNDTFTVYVMLGI